MLVQLVQALQTLIDRAKQTKQLLTKSKFGILSPLIPKPQKAPYYEMVDHVKKYNLSRDRKCRHPLCS